MLNKLKSKLSKKTPSHLSPTFSAYDKMGEEKVRLLANTFYDEMETNKEAKSLHDIHPKPMVEIRQKFFEFLSGWLGGPDLFVEKYGHPRLRARHLPFAIDDAMYQQWMLCMRNALDQVLHDDPVLKADLRVKFDQLAKHMINQ